MPRVYQTHENDPAYAAHRFTESAHRPSSIVTNQNPKQPGAFQAHSSPSAPF